MMDAEVQHWIVFLGAAPMGSVTRELSLLQKWAAVSDVLVALAM